MLVELHIKGTTMKNAQLEITILAVFSFFSGTTISAGFVNIPTTGFSGSAYMRCLAQPTTINGSITTSGNFGSGNSGNGNPSPSPSTTANNTCAIVPVPSNDLAAPETNYSFVTSATRVISINNIYTAGSINAGTVLEVVWRKPAASAPVTATPMCIIGTRVAVTHNAYSNSFTLSNERFAINDIVRGGLNGLNIDAAYALTNPTASRVYRIGRTYTSVQHRVLATAANSYGQYGGSAFPGTNYLDLPGTGATTISINGVNTFAGSTALAWPFPNPTSTQQDASVDDGWIDFTVDVSAADNDGTSSSLSAMTYIKLACNTDNAATINSTAAGGWTRPDVIRLRQTGQENAPFISVSTNGYVLPSQPAINPANTVPF